MTPKFNNNNDASALTPDRKGGWPFIGTWLMCIGLLLSVLQVVKATPRDAVGGTSVTITVIKDYSVAGSGNPDIIQVQLSPAPNPGDPLTFTIPGYPTAPVITTDPTTGIATLQLTGKNPGAVQVDITDPNGPVGSITVHFIAAPGPPDLTKSYITQVIQSGPADGTSQLEVKAVLYDQYGNPITIPPNGTTPVNFSFSPATAAMTTSGATNPNTNTAFAFFTSNTPGVYNVQAQVQVGGVWKYLNDKNNPTNNFVPIQFNALPADPTKSYIQVTTDYSADNNTTYDVVTAFLFNKLGNPVLDGTQVTFVIDPANTITVTNTNGLVQSCTTGSVQARFVSAVPGVARIEASMSVGGVSYTLNESPSGNAFSTIHFTSGPADPTKSYIVVTKDNSPADGASQDIVTAYLFDAKGFPVNQATPVSFSTPGPATIVNSANQTTSTGSASGQYVSTSTNPSQVTVQMTVGGHIYTLNDKNTSTPYSTLHYVNTAVDKTRSYITVTKNMSVADGTSQDIVTAYLFDTKGNPVTDGTPVTFAANSTSVTNVNGAVQNSTTGSVQAQYVSTVAGTYQITVTVAGGTITLNDQQTGNPYSNITFVSGPADPQHSYLVVTTDNATADGSSQDIVTVYLFDKNGNPVTNSTNPVTFTVQGPATIVGPATIQVTTSGQMAFVSTTAGAFQVKATLNGVALYDNLTPSNKYVTIHFVAGPPVPGGGGPGGGGGGGGGGGNPGGGGGGGNPGGGGSGGGGGGGNPGGGGGSGSGSGGSGTPPSPYTVEYVVYDFHLADGKDHDSVAAYVTDANKNPVQGANIVFAIVTAPTAGTATAGAQLVGTPAPTNGNGFTGIAIASTLPGTVFVSATLNGVPIDGSFRTVTFDTSPDVSNPLTALTTIIFEALADGTSQTQVKAHVVDMQGNIMEGQPITFVIDSGSGTIQTPQPVLTDANGDAYINITSKTPGDVLIKASVLGKQIVFGSPARVRFAPINIYVPRVFTPNNDGTNDILKPILVGISQFHYLSVYNRWGNLIFTTQDPNQGWDGTFKGVPQPVETYLWVAEAVDINGRKVVQRGMVSLAR